MLEHRAPKEDTMKCCICGQDLAGQPAMVDQVTGDAFCSRDSHYFGMHPSNRPRRATVEKPRSVETPSASPASSQTAADRPGRPRSAFLQGIHGFWSDLFGRSESTRKVSAHEYIQKTPPGPTPLHDSCQILRVWMNSAPVVSDQERLRALMEDFGQSWHVGWKKGTPEEVYGWFEECATADARSQGSGSNTVYGLDLPYQKYGAIVLDATPGFWEGYGVVGSVIQIGVCGAYHVIGKASDGEFLYLAHQ